MRTLKRNRQLMSYALPGQRVPIYALDSNGQIIYVEVDGQREPVKTGEYKTAYGSPVQFKGAIFSQLEDAILRAWGADTSNNYAVLVLDKKAVDNAGNTINLPLGTCIWRTNEVKLNADGTVDENSANYSVEGVMTEELNENSYYLRVF